MTSGAPTEAELLRMAEAAYGRGDLQESARIFAAVTKSGDPARAADALYGLGMVALRQGRRPEATQLFEAALRANARFANAWYQLGRLAEADAPRRAYEFYQRALAIDPSHMSAKQRIDALDPGDRGGGAAAQEAGERPPPARRGDAREGVVSNLVQRFEQRAMGRAMRTLYVWDFRVNREGLPPIAVEMRGFRFEGSLSNGDRVRLGRTAETGKVLHLNRIMNLSANAAVRVKRRPRLITTGLGILLQIIFFLVFAAVAITIVITILNHRP